jgi:acyl-CoA synthetase (AMP-forming)/AMP-acid ligase II
MCPHKFDEYISDFPATWIDLLQKRAEIDPDKTAFIFLHNGEQEGDRLSYGQLEQQAQAIASHLQSFLNPDDRVLLLYTSGLDFITAFFGCLFAGIIAVPAELPRPKRPLSRVRAIIADAAAKTVLTTSEMLTILQNQWDNSLDPIDWVVTDKIKTINAKKWQKPAINSKNIAFIQYTSGSTGNPKGVMVTHANLLHNMRAIESAFGHDETTIGVSWLPLFHDMGLIGHVLQPIYLNIPSILMPPLAFLQRPWRWLQAISNYRGTTSGAPDFAYDLCVRKITPEQRSRLDLSCWQVAFSGSEPVRKQTLEKFTKNFAPCGFRGSAFYPCYGMAEATLLIAGGTKNASPVIKTISRQALTLGQAVPQTSIANDASITLVSCGRTWPGQTLIIVCPETKTQRNEGEVGEIWLSGASVAQGYWQRPEQTQQTFQAYLASGEGPFLQTGDLGFIADGELFITGRCKDLIIIKGRNYYPQDIEQTASSSYEGFCQEGAAAFSIEVMGEEQLILLQEVDRQYRHRIDATQAIAAIANAVMAEYDLRVYDICLLKAGSLPKTPSGKIQRYRCRQLFLAGELGAIATDAQNLALGKNRLNQ